MSELVIFGIMAALIFGTLGIMVAWGNFVERREAVKDKPAVMSRGENSASENTPSSVRQTEAQTDRPPAPAVPSRDIMLDTFKRLRKYGMPREEARGMLKAMNLPLDNNLWADAAPPPPEQPAEHAPISGRPLPPGAKFHEDDPELQYQPLR